MEGIEEVKKNYEEEQERLEMELKLANLKNQELEAKLNDPALQAIEQNPEFLEQMKQLVEQKNESLDAREQEHEEFKQNHQKKLESLELLVTKKDDIIEELTKNNQLKDNEIKKMEDLINNFKDLFHHM